MTQARSLWFGAVTVFATRVGGLALNALTVFVLARLLGPSDLGAYYLLVLVPTSTLAIASFGLPAAITYASGRGEDLDSLRTIGPALALGLSAVLIVGLLVLAPVLAVTILAAVPMTLFPLALLAIPGTLLLAFANAVTLGRQRLRRYNAILLVQGSALLVGQVAVVAVGHAGLSGALATYVVTVSAVAFLAVISTMWLAPFHPRLDPAATRRLMSFGVRVQPASLASFFSYRADVFLLSVFLRDPTVLGYYSVAVSVAELCFYVPDAVSTVLFPRVAASDRARAAGLVPVVCRTAVLLTALAAAAIGLVASVLLPIVLVSFRPSVTPALILLPGVVGLSASKVLSGYLQGIGRPLPVSAVAAGSLLVNLIVNVILIPVWGINGAACASLVSYSLNGGAMLILSAREAGVPLRDMLVARPRDLAIIRERLPWLSRRRTSAT